MSDVKLTREGLERLHYGLSTRRSPFGDGREEVDSEQLDALLMAVDALLAATEPASDEEVNMVIEAARKEHRRELHETAGYEWRRSAMEKQLVRAAEARVRRLAFGEEGRSNG